MTYPVYFAVHFAVPWRKPSWLPRFEHRPPVYRGKYAYSQRYTGIAWGPISAGLVWRNPK